MGKNFHYECLNRDAAIEIIQKLLPEKDDCFLADLCEDIQRRPAETVGEGRDIVVTIRPGSDKYDIEFLHEMKKRIDGALTPIGFTRRMFGKWGHKVEFVYYQFAEALDESQTEKSTAEKDS